MGVSGGRVWVCVCVCVRRCQEQMPLVLHPNFQLRRRIHLSSTLHTLKAFSGILDMADADV